MAIRTYIEDGKKLYEVYLNGFDNRGKRIQRKRKGIDTLRKAEQIQFEIKRELAMIREEKVPLRWEEWFQECMKRMKMNFQPSTIMNYEKGLNKNVNPHWNKIEIHKIKQNDVYNMVFTQVSDELNPNSRRSILDMLKRIFQMAIEEGLIERNPATGIKIKVPQVDQKVLTNSEVEILLREAKVNNHRFFSVWTLALMTGMRSGELYALKWTDIDLEGKIISVNKQWTNKCGFGPTKTGRNRIVPISVALLHYLKKLKLERGQDEFVLPHLMEWENGMQASVLRDFCETVGITPVKFHDLRATFITNLLARGESLARVMSIVGHTQLKTTNLYLRKAGVDVQGGTEKLGYDIPDDLEGTLLTLVK